MNRREAVLSGVGAAAALHDKVGLRKQLESGDGPIDVFSVIESMGVPLAFRPLEGVLGLFLPPPAGPGIMVTTERPLHLQRFTAAHELGHFVLGHSDSSFDERIGFVARGDYSQDRLQEVAADAFAAEFMLPRWLLVAHARRHGWSRNDLRTPDVVYQLSLRVGMSYEATCLALAIHTMLRRTEVDALLAIPPRASKRRALGDVQPPSWRSDVWVLSANDAGTYVLGKPDDMIVLSLEEHAASGYTWDLSAAEENGLSVILDQRRDRPDAGFGAVVDRVVVFLAQGGGHISLVEKRAWSADSPLNELRFDLSFWGKEVLPRLAPAA
jgi:IrrE N-terminal-like domain/Chagasin family peptidase inhibitor I42